MSTIHLDELDTYDKRYLTDLFVDINNGDNKEAKIVTTTATGQTLTVEVVLCPSGSSKLINITYGDRSDFKGVEVGDEINLTYCSLRFSADPNFNPNVYQVDHDSLSSADRLNIHKGILEVVNRYCHWCAHVPVSGGKIRIQKSPVALDDMEDAEWNIHMRFISVNDDIEEHRDVTVLASEKERLLTVQKCIYQTAIEFDNLVYCNIAGDPWDYTVKPVWHPYTKQISKEVEAALNKLHVAPHPYQHLRIDTDRREAQIGLILTDNKICMGQFIYKEAGQWPERQIALSYPCTKQIVSGPLQGKFRMIEASGPRRFKRSFDDFAGGAGGAGGI